MPVVGVIESVVVLGLNVTVCQLFTMLLTLTEPSPVARSYAVVVV